MNFNTIEFLFFFFPATLALFYIVPVRLRLTVLFAASLVFYGASGLLPLLLLLSTIAWGYVLSNYARKLPKNLLIALCVSFPLVVLWLFKYLGFTLDLTGADAEARDLFSVFIVVLIPAGISFYTFQILAYCIDVADGTIEPERDPIKFGAFISYFPQLIAGPILRYSDIRDQLGRVAREKNIRPNLVGGLKFLAFGLFAKTFGADILLLLQESYELDKPTGSLDALFSIFAYSFVIYYDFWAYSIMAIGLARMFGIELPRNFREPYISFSPREFWRNWHVTLSYWVRDYVYIRLGGNRRYVANIIIAFLVTGLWHGAGLNFLAWGLYHAALVVGYHVTRPLWDRLPRPAGIGLTFLLVSFGWPLFYLDFDGWLKLLAEVFSLDFAGDEIFRLRHWLFLGIIAAWTFFARERWWLFNDRPRMVFDWAPVQASAMFVAILLFSFGREFIYFRF